MNDLEYSYLPPDETFRPSPDQVIHGLELEVEFYRQQVARTLTMPEQVLDTLLVVLANEEITARMSGLIDSQSYIAGIQAARAWLAETQL
jgi:hypothetical protein